MTIFDGHITYTIMEIVDEQRAKRMREEFEKNPPFFQSAYTWSASLNRMSHKEFEEWCFMWAKQRAETRLC